MKLGQFHVPAIYTRFTSFLTWINYYMCLKCIIMDLTNSLMTAIFINDIPMWPYTCYIPCYFKCQKTSSQVLFCLVNQVCQFCQSLWKLFIILPDIVGVSKNARKKNIQRPMIIEIGVYISVRITVAILNFISLWDYLQSSTIFILKNLWM